MIQELINGEAGDPDAVYGLVYDDEDDVTEMTILEIREDIADGSLKFV